MSQIAAFPATPGYASAAAYLEAQTILWGAPGRWAHETFGELNARYFTDAVPHAGIVWGLTPHGGRLGHCYRGDGRITLHPALLDPKSPAWGQRRELFGERFARDVLLHEMIHAFLNARGEVSEHNADPWCREVERLAAALGLESIRAEPVKARRINGRVVKCARDGYLTRKQLGSFPHSVRPAGYYEGSNGKMRIRL